MSWHLPLEVGPEFVLTIIRGGHVARAGGANSKREEEEEEELRRLSVKRSIASRLLRWHGYGVNMDGLFNRPSTPSSASPVEAPARSVEKKRKKKEQVTTGGVEIGVVLNFFFC